MTISLIIKHQPLPLISAPWPVVVGDFLYPTESLSTVRQFINSLLLLMEKIMGERQEYLA